MPTPTEDPDAADLLGDLQVTLDGRPVTGWSEGADALAMPDTFELSLVRNSSASLLEFVDSVHTVELRIRNKNTGTSWTGVLTGFKIDSDYVVTAKFEAES